MVFFLLLQGHGHGCALEDFVHVGMLVTLIATVHYSYMREYWVTIKQTPAEYRYIDRTP